MNDTLGNRELIMFSHLNLGRNSCLDVHLGIIYILLCHIYLNNNPRTEAERIALILKVLFKIC